MLKSNHSIFLNLPREKVMRKVFNYLFSDLDTSFDYITQILIWAYNKLLTTAYFINLPSEKVFNYLFPDLDTSFDYVTQILIWAYNKLCMRKMLLLLDIAQYNLHYTD
ncbi:unnamed protein product [Rhizophagus irregularis]|nr:unnamed protein product [Rhizophagus irregularis]